MSVVQQQDRNFTSLHSICCQAVIPRGTYLVLYLSGNVTKIRLLPCSVGSHEHRVSGRLISPSIRITSLTFTLFRPRMYSTRTAPWRPNSGKKTNANANTSAVSGLPGSGVTSRMQPDGDFAGANGDSADNSPEERGNDRFEYE
jgi:hypothetical protein